MDQVKAFLKVAKRHYFWILTVIVICAGLGTWFYASGQLRAEYDDNKSKIESAKSQIQVIQNDGNHPNDESKRFMNQRITELKQEVGRVWRTLYEHQRKNTLVWPQEIREDFIRAVAPLQPIEAEVEYPTPVEQELSQNFKERYRDYIKEELPKLAETIGSTWAPTAGPGGASYGGGESGRSSVPFIGGELSGQVTNPEDELLVIWNPQNQSQIQQERFDWSNKPGKVPSTLDVLYAQEDLWVLQTIVEIIARTNGDITAHHRATVKEIESIQMGRNALGLVGKVQRLESTRGPDDFFSGEYSQPVDSGETNPYEQRGGELGGLGGAGVDPADRRYVDQDNKPIPAEELRAALETNSPETASLSVAKRLPVRIRVSMDQRKIHELLAECGSAPLTIEVRQVRINRDAGTTGGGSLEYGGGGRESSGNDPYAGSGSNAPDPSTTYDVPVEIYGVVYIYNPPAEEILEISDDQKAEAAAAAVAPPPTATPAVDTSEEETPAEPAAEPEPAPAAAEPAPAPAEPAPGPAEPAATEPAPAAGG